MRKGFTLIELVMVIIILGILAATALPRFIDLQHKARESAAKGALGGIRAAIAIRYASNAAYNSSYYYPGTIEASMFHDGRIPVEPFSGSAAVEIGTGAPTGTTGGWKYDSTTGQVWINHSDYTDY